MSSQSRKEFTSKQEDKILRNSKTQADAFINKTIATSQNNSEKQIEILKFMEPYHWEENKESEMFRCKLDKIQLEIIDTMTKYQNLLEMLKYIDFAIQNEICTSIESPSDTEVQIDASNSTTYIHVHRRLLLPVRFMDQMQSPILLLMGLLHEVSTMEHQKKNKIEKMESAVNEILESLRIESNKDESLGERIHLTTQRLQALIANQERLQRLMSHQFGRKYILRFKKVKYELKQIPDRFDAIQIQQIHQWLPDVE